MFGNFGKMMKMLGQMKTRIPEMQARLATSEYSADAGDGAVAATVNGRMQVIDVKISPDVLDDGRIDIEALADMVKAAVSAAQDEAAEAARQAMREITGGADLPAGLDSMLD